MPAKAVKPEFPPSELSDRSEGWGWFGRIYEYDGYVDDGIWQDTVVRLDEFEDWPTEINDHRDNGWTHEL